MKKKIWATGRLRVRSWSEDIRGAARATSFLLALTTVGCGEASIADLNGSGVEPTGSVEVYYRGHKTLAMRYGKLLLVEGDIQVVPSDMWGGDDLESSPEDGALIPKGVSASGFSLQWPGGVVPFRFGNYNTLAQNPPGTLAGALNAAQQQALQTAMTDWEVRVPGLSFRARVATDSNFITFNLSTVCSSGVGRVAGDQEVANPLPGEQVVRVTNGCTLNHSAHHEIGHALGLRHEQNRADRNNWIAVNWSNIRGCTNVATSFSMGCADLPGNPVGGGACPAPVPPALNQCGCTANQVNDGTCRAGHNFDNLGNCANPGCDRSNLLQYDLDSFMHYATQAFSKNGNPTLTLSMQAQMQVAQNMINVGQRDHFSSGDVATMRALYPVAKVHPVFFADTGTHPLCLLRGREADRFGTDFPIIAGNFPGISNGSLDTSGLATGSYSVFCRARSLFWNSTYALPNTTVAFNYQAPISNVEEYISSPEEVAVLDPGLMAVLFN